MSDMEAINHVADRFVTAVTSGDRQAIEEVFSPSAVIWHNTTRMEESAVATVEAILAAHSKRPFCYQNIRRSVFSTGFVQQHDVMATDESGSHFQMPVCIVATVQDSRIVRLDEYYDSAQRIHHR